MLAESYSVTERMRDGREVEIRALRPDDREDMLAVLIAALAHDVEEQHAALSGIEHVFDRIGNEPRHGSAGQFQLSQRHSFDPSTGPAGRKRPVPTPALI